MEPTPAPPSPYSTRLFVVVVGRIGATVEGHLLKAVGMEGFFFFLFSGGSSRAAVAQQDLPLHSSPGFARDTLLNFYLLVVFSSVEEKKKMPSLLEMTLLFVTNVKKRNLKCKLCLLSKKGNLSDEFTCQDANC